MKKIILLFLSVIWMFACQDDAVSDQNNNGQDTDKPAYTFSEDEVVKGHIRIKLSEEPTGEIGTRSADGKMRTGVRALDNSSAVLGITHMERTFPHAGQFEERTRREGLHLWYDVWFSEEVASTRAASDISVLDGIQIASPVLKVRPTAASSGSPFNDIELPKQWGFHNPGTERWQVEGADIRIFDIWEQYNGHPDIIVSIVDGGIALDNPDLQANLWTSKEIPNNGIDDDGNGYVDDVYGYNFVSNSAKITPHRHGTHVAGTIGATNNNQIGVSGIAGGNGTPNSGVKLMSCQVFEHPQGPPVSFEGRDNVSTNIGAAIKYGADNGAVISQNSWGYAVDSETQPSYIEPAHKEAIDYFIKYAGCDNDGNQLPGSPMKGGIVLFASGNANTSNPRIAAPADYDKVLGVAAIGPDYKKPPYSNYGDYMDICAPGGTENGIRGIYSTTVAEYGYYEYRYGTSMACPHVAGVAALIIEKYGVGKQGFTARQLEEILLTTTYDVDQYNPTYAGQLGTGCVNAYAALYDEVPETQPFTLVSNAITDGTLSFIVDMQMAGNATITIVNNTGMTVMRKKVTTVRYVTSTLDIAPLAAGYYTLEYECNGSKITERFIKY